MTESPDWARVACNLLRAIDLARHAYKDSRRPRPSVDVDQVRRCALEISRFVRQAKEYVPADDHPPRECTDEQWRSIVLNLLRAHSLVWETLWLQYDGLPKREDGSGMGEPGAEITRCVLAAVAALSATNPDFDSVDWNGREMLRG